MDGATRQAALGAVVFTMLVPCTVAGLVPYLLITANGQLFHFGADAARGPGILLCVTGVVIYAWCAYDFAVAGHGTPSPTHPPSELVVRGLYRYSRNPMYVGVSAVLFGEALFFGSGNQLAYAVCIFIAFHLRVILAEEKTLVRMFGAAYERYCTQVPRWVGPAWRKGSHEN